ncbi:MAG: hypothetical protein JWM33_3526 [Caulobacteraceae bacterium]|nr:hypothetical protein [Caulobacteraceae bacterium]
MSPETIRERDLGYAPGAVFYEQGGMVMFRFVIDPGSQIGPRVASARDIESHLGAYAAFKAGRAATPTRALGSGISISVSEPDGGAPAVVPLRGRRGRTAP